MLTKLCFFVGLLCCYISRVDASDILNGFTSKLSKYSVVNPQVIHRLTRSINRPQTEQSFHEGDTVSYALNINDRNHILHLKRNRDFLSPDFLKSLHKASYPKNHNHCYYHGKVEGHEDSVVALSTCSGLRGVIILGNDTYGLEPVPETSNHILYLMKDVQSEPSTCGVVDKATSTHNHSHFEPGLSMTSLLRKKRSLPETSYVELVLVADKQRYNFKNQNENAVREEMIELANLLDGYYKPLNIRVVLVGVKIFKTENPFDVEGSAGDVLGRFVKWRKSTLLPEIRNDNAQLVVGRSGAYDGGVLGMAFVGTICSAATSGGINVFNNNALSQFSTVLAHEMGHNLGMSHDGANCACKTASCIMSATASGGMTFSSCSESYFETLVLRGGGLCLKNQPSLSDVVSIPKCGNGLLEKGEECDCGTPEECKNECCHAATCKLTSGAACAHGSCCSNCQLKVPGAPCRSSLDTCDLPEFCDGKGSFCPDDFYMMDGLSCENNAAYCYEGRCQTYNYQCRHLFAPDPAIKAADICFKTANVRGNRFGNCGRRGNTFISCTTDNAMCGKVQCTNVDVNTPPNGAQVTIEIIQGETCVNADFHVGTDVLDPAYVNPGSPCAKGKTCLDFACVNASVLLPGLDCNAQTTCHGRGVR